MKNIQLRNEMLATRLSTITSMCFKDDVVQYISTAKEQIDNIITDVHSCTTEYLYRAFDQPIEKYGYPRSMLGYGMKDGVYSYNTMVPVINMCDRVGGFLGTPENALFMVYPDNGYIGWHHNGNAPGYNVLLTYSQDGDGWFDYYDYETKSIVRLQDQPGWNVRVGYYPCQHKEPNRVFWHMAQTKKQRITCAWVINHKEMWKNMIEEITLGDFDPKILEQGPRK